MTDEIINCDPAPPVLVPAVEDDFWRAMKKAQTLFLICQANEVDDETFVAALACALSAEREAGRREGWAMCQEAAGAECHTVKPTDLKGSPADIETYCRARKDAAQRIANLTYPGA